MEIAPASLFMERAVDLECKVRQAMRHAPRWPTNAAFVLNARPAAPPPSSEALSGLPEGINANLHFLLKEVSK